VSGVDEQHANIPICPICGERPMFWSLYPIADGSTNEGWIWLYSKKYKPSHTDCNRLSYFCSPGLDAIKSVRCRTLRSFNRHFFEEGSEVFEAVMKVARREQNERH